VCRDRSMWVEKRLCCEGRDGGSVKGERGIYIYLCVCGGTVTYVFTESLPDASQRGRGDKVLKPLPASSDWGDCAHDSLSRGPQSVDQLNKVWRMCLAIPSPLLSIRSSKKCGARIPVRWERDKDIMPNLGEAEIFASLLTFQPE